MSRGKAILTCESKPRNQSRIHLHICVLRMYVRIYKYIAYDCRNDCIYACIPTLEGKIKEWNIELDRAIGQLLGLESNINKFS